jgi:hypothetical protein
MYGLATAIISPKLLVPTFIGSRIRLLSEKGEQMSAGSKAVNICSIIVTVSIGIFTGWYIYQRFGPMHLFPPIPMLNSFSIELWLARKSSKPRSAKRFEDLLRLIMQPVALITPSPKIPT